MAHQHKKLTLTLLILGWILIASELAFFFVYFANIHNVYALRHSDDAAAMDGFTDLIFCGFHFLGTGIALSELLSRLHRDYTDNELYDPELVTPTAILISFLSIFVDLGGYLRTQVAHSPSLVTANAIGNMSNSIAVFIWAVFVTADLFWYDAIRNKNKIGARKSKGRSSMEM